MNNYLTNKNLYSKKQVWLTPREAAVYLRKVNEDGKPSVKSIYNAIYRRQIKAKKFLGKWLIKKSDLDKSIESSYY